MNSSSCEKLFSLSPNYPNWIGEKSSEWKINLYINYGETYSPEVIEQTKLIDEYTPKGTDIYHIYDTSCHIMMELTGQEQNGIFDDHNINQLSKDAFLKAYLDANVSKNESLSEEQENSIGGIAIWNLLLPKKQGGVFPDELYDKFLLNLTEKLQVFKPVISSSSVIITPQLLEKSFLNFKTLALKNYAVENKMDDLDISFKP